MLKTWQRSDLHPSLGITAYWRQFISESGKDLNCHLLAGKTSIVRSLAAMCNQELVEISLTAGSDTSDMLGGFEQLNPAASSRSECLARMFS